MNSRIVLMAVLGLGLLLLVSMWPMLVRKFFRGVEDRSAGQRARKDLESGSPAQVLEEVDRRIAEQQAEVDKYIEGPGDLLQAARRQLRELKEYRERLIHEARERGMNIPD